MPTTTLEKPDTKPFDIIEIFNREYADKGLLSKLAGKTIAQPVEKVEGYFSIVGMSARLEDAPDKGHIVHSWSDVPVPISFPDQSCTKYFNCFAVDANKAGESFITDIKKDGGKLVYNDDNQVVGIVVAAFEENKRTIIAPAYRIPQDMIQPK